MPERVAKALFATVRTCSGMHPGPQSPRCLAKNAPVAQLDRAPDYESGGQEFESLRARHQVQKPLFYGNNSIVQWLRPAALVSSGGINDACWNGSDQERTWRLPCAEEGTDPRRGTLVRP